MHAFTYRWINVYKTLFITYVRLTQYSVSEHHYLVNEYICLIRKKEKVKLDSYRWGLKLQCHVR